MLTLNHTFRLGHVMHLPSVENLEELEWPPVLKVLACVVFVSKHINQVFAARPKSDMKLMYLGI